MVATSMARALRSGNISDCEVLPDGATNARTSAVLFSEIKNVKDYGALGDGTTNDTTAIQAAIDAASAVSQEGGVVYFPEGRYIISSLDLTDFDALTLRGAGIWSTRLYADAQSSASPILDCCGAFDLVIEGLSLAASDTAGAESTTVPTCAILFATSSTAGAGKVRLKDCHIGGHVSIGLGYIYSATSLVFEGVIIQSNKATIPALIVSDDNAEGISSPNTTIDTGTKTTANVEFYSCELHSLATSAASGQTILLDGALAVHFFGGVISAGAPDLITLRGTTKNISFIDVAWDVESGAQAPTNTINNEGTCHGLRVEGLITGGTVSATGGFLAGSATALFMDLGLRGGANHSWASGGKLINIEDHATATTVRIDGGYIEASGEELDIGGSTGANTIILDPGTLTVPGGANENALLVGTNYLLGGRVTGWSAATGNATRTTFATATVTTEELAERVKALIDDLTTHGIIGS